MSAFDETTVGAVENTGQDAQAAASDAVEATIEAMKNTSISSKNDAQQQETSEVDAAHAVSAAEGRRLYIGNLAYSTTDEQLKAFFAGFSIESTSIPTNPRTGRAVGYAFVDLTTKEEADRAIAELTGKEVLERKVSVQLARKPGSAGNGPKKGIRESEEGTAQPESEQSQQGPSKRRGSGFKGRGRGKAGRGGAKRSEGHDGDEKTDEAAAIPVTGQAVPLGESTNVKADVADSSGPHHAEGSGRSGFKPKKRRGPPENGVPSCTKIMVANLPYELSEDKLKELFIAYQPESAKIALRPIPRFMVRKLQARGEPRKGRGFGFVTLTSEEMQKKAVEEMNGHLVDGRQIAVKIAIDSQTSDSEDKENSHGNSENNESQNGVTIKLEAKAQVGSVDEAEVAAA